MANYVAKFGNIYQFAPYTPGEAVRLEFDRPISKFRFCHSGAAITDDSGIYKATFSANVDGINISKNGHPNYINYAGTSAVSPVVMVTEYGISANPEYWATEEV